MADHAHAHRTARPVLPVEDGSSRTERRVNIRVFIYVIGLHVFAGFAMLLFFLGRRGA